jgi:hypothetical protein
MDKEKNKQTDKERQRNSRGKGMRGREGSTRLTDFARSNPALPAKSWT